MIEIDGITKSYDGNVVVNECVDDDRATHGDGHCRNLRIGQDRRFCG